MNNPRFVDNVNITLVLDKDNDDDGYNTPITSRVDETSFKMPGSTKKERTLPLKLKVKQNKLTALYRHI